MGKKPLEEMEYLLLSLLVSKANHSIQVYARTINAKEAEVEQFYEDLYKT